MENSEDAKLVKISVRIWQPILNKLQKKMDEACLRRDAYLNKVLEKELDHLDSEVSMPNSQEAQAHVAQCLDRLPRKLVSLSLRPDLVDKLGQICERKKIVRDAFFNRLFFLLAVKPEFFDRWLGGRNWRKNLFHETSDDPGFWVDHMYPLEPSFDPFWAIRERLRECSADAEIYDAPGIGKIRVQYNYHRQPLPVDAIYSQFFSRQFEGVDITGLNCYLPDFEIPNSPAAIKQKELDELLLKEFGG